MRASAEEPLSKAAGALGAAAAVGPQILIPSARGAKKDKVVFVSEESNPKAIAVYDKINADFKKETGIEGGHGVPGLRQHRQARGHADRRRHPARDRLVRRRAGHEPGPGEPAGGRGRRASRPPAGSRTTCAWSTRARTAPSPPASSSPTAGTAKTSTSRRVCEPMKTWEDFLNVAKTLNNPPNMYGCIMPSAETGRLHASAGDHVHEQQRALVRVQRRQEGLRSGPGQGREQEAGGRDPGVSERAAQVLARGQHLQLGRADVHLL